MQDVDDVLTVRRWQRYGADRLYVTRESGARIGSVDLQSGEVVVDEPAMERLLRSAAQEYLRADVAELVVPARLAAPQTVDDAELRAWLGPVPGDATVRRERGRSVRDRLESLAGEGWQVVHDVPLGRQGSNVAHLLVGPGGIVTVGERWHVGQTVHVEGRVMRVDGRPVPYLRDARLEAARVQWLLLAAACTGASVRAVLVVVTGAGELVVRGPAHPADPLVTGRPGLLAVLRALPRRLSDERVAAVAKVARERSTWAL